MKHTSGKLMTDCIVIAAGGTGGHLFPATRLALVLREKLPKLSLIFAGGGLKNSPHFPKEEFDYEDCPCSPWMGFGSKQLWKLFKDNFLGVSRAIRLLLRYKPKAVIGFGSFHTIPVMTAARLLRIPLMLYEANAIPGRAISLFSHYAKLTATQFPLTLKGHTRQVAMSGRALKPCLERAKRGRIRYGLKDGVPTILVAGGSQGALKINELVLGLASAKFPLQIIHLTGRSAPIEHYRSHYHTHRVHAHVIDFEDEMELAWSCADLFIGRSGASTIAELLEAQIPALLLPYPYAKDDHQQHNARFFVETVGGGLLLDEKQTTQSDLCSIVTTAFNSGQLQQWRTTLQSHSAVPLPTLAELSLEFFNDLND